MSISTRGVSANPANVSRDYGLLQAPNDEVRPFPSLDGDEAESEVEEEEHEDALRAIRRYQTFGSVYDVRRGYTTDSERAVRHSFSRSHPEEHLAPPTRGRQALSDAASAVSSTSAASSREPSQTRSNSRNSRLASASLGRTRPSSFIRSSGQPGTRDSFHQGNHGVEGTSLASRYRDLVLGGEPVPPPLEQVQQQYLQQHYTQDHADLTSGRTTSGARRLSFNTPGMASHPVTDSKSFVRRWSRSSGVVPRRADVAQVIEQLHLQEASATDVEDASGNAHERTSLLVGRPSSYAALSLTPSGPGASGVSVRTVIPGDHTRTSHISLIASTTPGPGAAADEAKTICRYTLPIWATHSLELSINSITVLVIGHLGTAELAAASLASLTGNVTGFSVIQGFISALDSLLPAAYSSDRPSAVGLWTQRMVVILVALLVPIALIWFCAESILLALKQDPEVAHLAALYLRVMVLALPAYAGFETSRRYLQAQGLFSAPTIAVGIASVANIPLQLLLVHGPEPVRIGFLGAPIASTLSFWIMFLFGLFQCWVVPRDAWGGLTRKAFEIRGLLVVWNLGLASTLAMAAEWWAWEVANLMSSTLGTTALAAQSCLLVTCSLTYQLPSSIGVAAAVRIGNLLGANQPSWAALSARTATAASLLCGMLNSAIMICFRNQWGWIFSSDPELIGLISAILPYVGGFQIADGLCTVGSGILRGSGRQSQGAVINIFAYYAAGLPLAGYLLITCGWGLQGIWLGLSTGLFLAAFGFMVLTLRTDWRAEATKVLARMDEDAIPSTMVEATIEANIDSVLEEVGSIAEEDEEDLEDVVPPSNGKAPVA